MSAEDGTKLPVKNKSVLARSIRRSRRTGRVVSTAAGAHVAAVQIFLFRAETFLGTELFDTAEPIGIGRSRRSGLRLQGDTVSRRHCRLVYEDGQLFVEDLGSANGTYVNRVRAQGLMPVASTDAIHIGAYTLKVRSLRASREKGSIETADTDQITKVEAVFSIETDGQKEAAIDLSAGFDRRLYEDAIRRATGREATTPVSTNVSELRTTDTDPSGDQESPISDGVPIAKPVPLIRQKTGSDAARMDPDVEARLRDLDELIAALDARQRDSERPKSHLRAVDSYVGAEIVPIPREWSEAALASRQVGTSIDKHTIEELEAMNTSEFARDLESRLAVEGQVMDEELGETEQISAASPLLRDPTTAPARVEVIDVDPPTSPSGASPVVAKDPAATPSRGTRAATVSERSLPRGARRAELVAELEEEDPTEARDERETSVATAQTESERESDAALAREIIAARVQKNAEASRKSSIEPAPMLTNRDPSVKHQMAAVRAELATARDVSVARKMHELDREVLSSRDVTSPDRQGPAELIAPRQRQATTNDRGRGSDRLAAANPISAQARPVTSARSGANPVARAATSARAATQAKARPATIAKTGASAAATRSAAHPVAPLTAPGTNAAATRSAAHPVAPLTAPGTNAAATRSAAHPVAPIAAPGTNATSIAPASTHATSIAPASTNAVSIAPSRTNAVAARSGAHPVAPIAAPGTSATSIAGTNAGSIVPSRTNAGEIAPSRTSAASSARSATNAGSIAPSRTNAAPIPVANISSIPPARTNAQSLAPSEASAALAAPAALRALVSLDGAARPKSTSSSPPPLPRPRMATIPRTRVDEVSTEREEETPIVDKDDVISEIAAPRSLPPPLPPRGRSAMLDEPVIHRQKQEPPKSSRHEARLLTMTHMKVGVSPAPPTREPDPADDSGPMDDVWTNASRIHPVAKQPRKQKPSELLPPPLPPSGTKSAAANTRSAITVAEDEDRYDAQTDHFDAVEISARARGALIDIALLKTEGDQYVLGHTTPQGRVAPPAAHPGLRMLRVNSDRTVDLVFPREVAGHLVRGKETVMFNELSEGRKYSCLRLETRDIATLILGEGQHAISYHIRFVRRLSPARSAVR